MALNDPYRRVEMNVFAVGDGDFAHLGSRPGVHTVTAILGLVVVGFAAIMYLARAKPWYEGNLVDRGSGKLSES